jgi:predicted nucleic-acid-binding Zn-ribbon protein
VSADRGEERTVGSLEEKIAERFVCGKCRNSSGEVRRFAATGAGITRLIDWQRNEFLAVSCESCGFTELYDPRVFEDKDRLTEILDLVFGLGE